MLDIREWVGRVTACKLGRTFSTKNSNMYCTSLIPRAWGTRLILCMLHRHKLMQEQKTINGKRVTKREEVLTTLASPLMLG